MLDAVILSDRRLGSANPEVKKLLRMPDAPASRAEAP
jgi:hypothetical protein